ncbi:MULTISPECIES: DUF7289 family protein [Haloarcula]|uniref:DUF7289 family protein n=1 Tax=Haloarcula TaxID=2237 RepID=UPI0023EC9583|nr:hypothetical protein [Halomicroarcula sp. XH51]
MGSREPPLGTRAQSAPLGLLLVFAVMFIGATAVVALGSGAITTTQDQLANERAEQALTQLDSETALVALGSSNAQTVHIPGGVNDGYVLDETAGHVTIEHEKPSGTVTLVDRDLGSVRTTGASSTVAYQGGGVWKETDGGSVMVSPPEFHYRNATLTFPIISVEGDTSLSERASVRRTSSNEVDVSNPIQNGTIVVTITSDYYRAWGQYFETRTDGEVSYDPPNQRVTIDLVTPIGTTKLTSAVAGLSSGSLQVQGNGGRPCGDSPGSNPFYTDSYNSSEPGDYCSQYSSGATGSNGNVTFGGSVDYQGNANFHGNIRSGSDVDITGSADINGDIYWTDSFSASGSASYDSEEQISGVDTRSPLNHFVATMGQDVADDNDNDDANDAYDAITGGPDPTLDFSSRSTVTIENAGRYHLERIDLGSGETLELDTNDGAITIVVDEYVDVSGTIDVQGDNRVNVYVRTMGANPSDGKVSVSGWRDAGLRVHGGTVSVPGDDAPQLRFYANDTFNASVDGGQFTGVLWAPVGAGGPGGTRVENGDIYGGIVSGDVNIDTKGRIHYDQALGDTQVVSRKANVVKITYVHVSENTVRFED